jgi:C-terminal processing protease CtpA/Prc
MPNKFAQQKFSPLKSLLAAAFLIFVLSRCTRAQEAPISSMERSIIETMLNDVKSDVKSNYYDTKFHGVDLDARFSEASARIKKAATYNQALATVAWALRSLDDSHTYLAPPRRNYKFSYGYQFMMVGDGCYVVAVRPNSDAEKKGLRVGDRILTLNRVSPTHDNLLELNYLFRVLRPQAVDELSVQSIDGSLKTFSIVPAIKEDTMHIFEGLDYWDLVREYQSYLHMIRTRWVTLGESAIVWSFPTFVVDEKAIDEIIGQSQKYPYLILDLRGNGGGYELTALRLIGSLFDKDLTVWTPVVRKSRPAVIAKTRGDKVYKGKIIVLVDSRSASASELFARTIQMQKRGIVIGDLSSGKVMEARFHFHQLGLDSAQGYGTSITEADLIMPDGKSLEKVGVTPDEKMLPSATDIAANRDPVLAHAIELAGSHVSAEDAGKYFPIEWPKE